MSLSSTISAKEFHQSGMLYRANRDFFWPLGLALAVTFDKETGAYEPKMHLLATSPAEVIEDPDADLDARSDEWIARRLDGIIP